MPPTSKNPIDRTMERATLALEHMDYFLAERLASESLRRAHRKSDFLRMARITLPLQEARRQIRQLAADLALNQLVPVIADPAFIENDPIPGCFLFQPPLIGADARTYREAANAADIPTFLLTREPTTRDNLWPIVAVGQIVLRTKLPPPSESPDLLTCASADVCIPLPWFEAAAEQLGDSTIARLNPADPAAWQIDDLMEFLEALPDHEKLHQRLEAACLEARHQNLPTERRPRPMLDDPFSF